MADKTRPWPAGDQARLGPGTTANKPKTTKIVARPKKLSFKEQRELDQLPAVIETLENEQRALAGRVAAPEFYRESAAAIKAALARAEELPGELVRVYARWAELDTRK